jgi:heterodisulfide reductase subunit C
MYAVATTLCEMAEEEGIQSSEPHIHLFEKLFLKSVQKHGRVEELKTVMAFNVRTWNPFKDFTKGMRLMLKGAISPLDMVKSGQQDKKVSRIFSRVQEMKKN